MCQRLHHDKLDARLEAIRAKRQALAREIRRLENEKAALEIMLHALAIPSFLVIRKYTKPSGGVGRLAFVAGTIMRVDADTSTQQTWDDRVHVFADETIRVHVVSDKREAMATCSVSIATSRRTYSISGSTKQGVVYLIQLFEGENAKERAEADLARAKKA